MGSISWLQMFGPACIVFMDYLSGLITDDTSITAVSSYGVRLQ